MSKRSSAIVSAIIALSFALSLLLTIGQPTAAQDAYPAPDQTVPGIGGPDAYPAPESLVAPGIQASPDGEALELETIGSGRGADPFAGLVEPTEAEAAAQEPPASSGGLFLWGSFLAALLIFVTAVAGSIVLFTRRSDA